MADGTESVARQPGRSPAGSLPVKQPAWWSRAWARWKRFGHVVGDFQARVLLTIIYFLVLAPYGLVVRLFGDPLNLKRAPRPSNWISKPEEDPAIEQARRQF